jgi:DNA-binding NarL/FixJ family response regulator
MTQRPRVLLADDHALVADSVARLLDSVADVVGVAYDGNLLLRLAREQSPDIVVSDLSMPIVGGLEAMRLLRAERPSCRFIAMTVHDDPDLVAKVLTLGARGFVLKHAAGDELIEAVRVVAAGGTYVSPRIAGSTLRAMTERQVSPIDRLSVRQAEVVRLLADGHRMKEVASILGISVRTVEHHKYEAMAILGVASSAELIRCVVHHTLRRAEAV